MQMSTPRPPFARSFPTLPISWSPTVPPRRTSLPLPPLMTLPMLVELAMIASYRFRV
jgi:hypothetical protein